MRVMRSYPCRVNRRSLRRPRVDILGGFDVHRKQITFDYMEMETGEVHRGKIQPADRENLRLCLECFTERFPGQDAAIAVEATTGWRYVLEELLRAGIEPHLAEPAETRSLQGRKKRAKTDRIDAGHLRDLLVIDRLPESWIPPQHIQEIRTLIRMRHSMIEERSAHLQRIHAQLFHNGHPQERNLLATERRKRLQSLQLPAASRKVVDLSLAMIEHINEELEPIEAELRAYARAQSGKEGGAAAKLGGRAPPMLRWAEFEASQSASRRGSPDHSYYVQTKEKLGGNRAALSVARKLLRRAHHTLRKIGEEAISEPVRGRA